MTPVVLALGANLGDRLATLQSAVDALAAVAGLTVTAVSPVFQTRPVGGPTGQPDYLNAVLLADADLPPADLLAACQQVEADHDRIREVRWGPRTLDVDIITYGQIVDDDERLTLPHPRAAQRAFVLAPWSQVDPQAELPGPGGGPVGLLAAGAPDRFELRPFEGSLVVPGT